jgi:hypothetical protein
MLMILLVRRLFRLARLAVLFALLCVLFGAVDHAAGPDVAHVRAFVAEVERALSLGGPSHAPTGHADERLGPVTRTTGCRESAGLPDRRCTPGAVRRGISLALICRRGYSRSVRPPVSFTEPLKRRQMRAYHLPGPPGAYEEDHLVALSLGGAPRDPANLWPEPRDTQPNAAEKDTLEAWAARMACERRRPIAELQRDMAHDWVSLDARTSGG